MAVTQGARHRAKEQRPEAEHGSEPSSSFPGELARDGRGGCEALGCGKTDRGEPGEAKRGDHWDHKIAGGRRQRAFAVAPWTATGRRHEQRWKTQSNSARACRGLQELTHTTVENRGAPRWPGNGVQQRQQAALGAGAPRRWGLQYSKWLAQGKVEDARIMARQRGWPELEKTTRFRHGTA